MGLGGASSFPGMNILPVEPPGGYTPWDKNIGYGNRDTHFGGADYGMALMNVGSRDRGALANRRKEILNWLDTDEGQSKLADPHKRGMAGGLYERIAGGDQSWSFGQNPGANPGNRDYYGGVDYLHNLALGKSDKEIAEFAEANKSKFRLQNDPSKAFGLYSQIQDRADQARQTESIFSGLGDAVTQASGELNTRLGDMSSDFSGQLRKQREDSQAQMEQFSADQKAYERQQSAWQQRQTAATQQMQIQQMKALRQKPVMQIMPTGGGGGMSAGSLAKKKKQITGLNIK